MIAGRASLLAGAAVLLAPLFLLTGYHLFELTLTAATALAILGLDLVTGHTGQISLGHGAFYAIGAYVTAILMADCGVPYWATPPASALVSAATGFAIGLPALRLRGHYLALTTFALAVALPQILKYRGLEGLTGGVQGVVLVQPGPPFGLPLTPDQWLYLFSLAVAVPLFLLVRNLTRGRIGLAMVAARDHPLAAEAMGIDLAWLKTGAFAISAMITGIAGSLGAIAVQFVAPDSFPPLLSIFLFVGLVVGGIGSAAGAVIGALFVQFVPDLAEQVSKAAPGAVYGIALIAVLYLMPQGAAGALASLPQLRRRGALAAARGESPSRGGTGHVE
ncbi:MAG TPA: branched-chain amino acid ABC transporter permease [Acetobacteraceae bacterium]|nr:branched-chain amino acid ABC transporter permease [Acetobacteraceae bacterium]